VVVVVGVGVVVVVDVDVVVVVDGRVVVDGGRVLTVDEPALLEDAEALGAKLGEVLGPRRYHPLPATEGV
jgi:hypothetical protein